MSDKKKHQILNVLLNKYQAGEEKSGLGSEVTDLGKSMTNIQIHSATSIDIKLIDNLCYALTNQGHLTIFRKDEQNKAHRYLITPSGQQAVIDKVYLKALWYRKQNFWFQLATILIALGTLVWTLYKDTNHQSDIQKLQKELDSLKAVTLKTK